MSDEDRKKYWATVTDPFEALRVIVENSNYFGYDPYYGDMHDALLDMAERVAQSIDCEG